ncbi:MAG: hypothetical protein WCO30_00780 [bacterium]
MLIPYKLNHLKISLFFLKAVIFVQKRHFAVLDTFVVITAYLAFGRLADESM